MKLTPKVELETRMKRFTSAMGTQYPDWELCAVVGGINMFYLTGTMCDGLLLIKRNDAATLWVRRSYERALIESEFADIRPMRSFRDIADEFGSLPDTLLLDTANATLEWLTLFSKRMPFQNILPIDAILLNIRAVKSEYELGFMRHAGAEKDRIYREVLPTLLHEGMSEVELGAELFSAFLKSGFHGVCRFSMKSVDSILGHVAFGDSVLYPSAFNGAGGMNGLCPAVPALGNHDRYLKKGDLIYLDINEGFNGYHVDKTTVFSYKTSQNEDTFKAHMHCLELERLAASMLKPGAIPSEIYVTILDALKDEYRDYFMGAKGRTVPFLGHGIGLLIDEVPVIAKNFNNPLEENMTIAIEPKISIDGIGMVGSENTYLVTSSGGVSLTGAPRGLEVV